MKMHIGGFLAVCAVALIPVCFCSCTRNNAVDIAPADYMAIQKKAEAFMPETGKHGGSIVLPCLSVPQSFNPITLTNAETRGIVQYMYEGLVRENGINLLPEPALADTWEIGADKCTWTFHIRPGVLWSDSVPFSAYDVEFTFNSLIYNNDISPNPSRNAFILDGRTILVKALDSAKVRFNLSSPYAPFLRSLTQEILPRHKYSANVGDKSFASVMGTDIGAKDLAGTGPFILDSYIPSQKIILKRNPHYYKKDRNGLPLPYLDSLVFVIKGDRNEQAAAFKKNELDYSPVSSEEFPGLKKIEVSGAFTMYRLGPSGGSNFLFFNQNTGTEGGSGKPYVDKAKLAWFRNEAFRKAVAHAIDKNSMITMVMNGLGYAQWSPMPVSEGYFCNSVAEYPYDPKKAVDILGKQGFNDGNRDGILEDRDGRKVEFTIITNRNNAQRVKIGEILKKNLDAIGMRVRLEQLDFDTIMARIDYPPYNWEAALMGLTGDPEPDAGKNVWRSNGSLHMWFPLQETPSTDWEARIDSLFDAGVRELDPAKRKDIYTAWQVIAADKLPLIYTVLPEQIYCLSNKFGNINPSVNGGLLHNIEWIFRK